MIKVIKVFMTIICLNFPVDCVSDIDTAEGEDEDLDNNDNEEAVISFLQYSFWTSREIKAIIGGCACFWGGIFTIFFVYLSVVFFRKSINAEASDSGGD